MQKLVLLSVTCLTLILQARSQSTYLIKSAKIDFTFSYGVQKGTRTFIFNDSGINAREETVRYTDTNFFFNDTAIKLPDTFREGIRKKTTTHLLVIQTRDSVYHIDLDASVGQRTPRYFLNMDSGLPMGTKKIGVDTFLGRKCDIFDFYGFKLWKWKGIILKREYITPEGGRIYDNATMVDENYVAGNDAFDIPASVIMKN